MENQEKPLKIWKRKNIHLVNEENDIKFRGPLSYRHLRIFGWMFLFLAQLGLVFNLADSVGLLKLHPVFIDIVSLVGSLTTPLFLIAAFSQVLIAKRGYFRLLRTYILGAVGIYLLFLIVFLHFGVGTLFAINGNFNQAYQTADGIITLINSTGTLSINIFIDLLLCTLVTFFINYHPSKYFQGKKIYIFRSFVILPILYEIASITLKLLASLGTIHMIPFIVPLLTTKPPVAFFIFIALALFVKNRGRHYIKHGKTREEYKKFLNTNVNRLHFTLFLIGMIAIAVIVDLLIFALIFGIRVGSIPANNDPSQYEQLVINEFQETISLGFGVCFPMLLIIPILVFFDYTKTYEDKVIDLIIPIAGIVLLAILYIEGSFEVFRSYLISIRSKSGESEIPSESINNAIDNIKNIFKK